MIADELLRRCLLELMPLNNRGEQVLKDVRAYLSEFSAESVPPADTMLTTGIVGIITGWNRERSSDATRDLLQIFDEKSIRGDRAREFATRIYKEVFSQFHQDGDKHRSIRDRFFTHPDVNNLWIML